MKYKVGDKVCVRSDLKRGKTYYMEGSKREHNSAIREMIELAGEIVTIKDAWGQYYIEEHECSWTDEMFEDVREDNEI